MTTIYFTDNQKNTSVLFWEAIKNGTKKTFECDLIFKDMFFGLVNPSTEEVLYVWLDGTPKTFTHHRAYLEQGGLENIPGASTIDEGIKLMAEGVRGNQIHEVHVHQLTIINSQKFHNKMEEIKALLLESKISIPHLYPHFLVGCSLDKPDKISKTPFRFNFKILSYLVLGLEIPMHVTHELAQRLFADEKALEEQGYIGERTPQIIFYINPRHIDLELRVKIEYYPNDGGEKNAYDQLISNEHFTFLVNQLEQEGLEIYEA